MKYNDCETQQVGTGHPMLCHLCSKQSCLGRSSSRLSEEDLPSLAAGPETLPLFWPTAAC